MKWPWGKYFLFWICFVFFIALWYFAVICFGIFGVVAMLFLTWFLAMAVFRD